MSGNFESYEACVKLRNETETYYRDNLNMNIRADYFLRKNRKLYGLIPDRFKKPAKLLLSKFIPWYF
jgi:hypothetical protein